MTRRLVRRAIVRGVRWAALCLGAGALLWTLGLVWFGLDTLQPPKPPPRCDGIVALTGGQDRIETSLRLLGEGYGQRLLISGVGPHATLRQLSASIPPGMEDRITLGRRAITTIGNSVETAEWARRYALHSVIVVTAGYHIRRAMTEIQRAAPDLKLYPYRVRPPALRRPFNRASLLLIAREYDKWLGSKLGLSRGTGLLP
ncbi:YdcF family protein [Acidomonas methanolica]|uniref:DUF218 domain-containing protein n=1 Tax=Acidomonas methanolica NBRC 104435 TaxID=1231351 RepID=A0A023D1U7_ACIMT|nr:YdcF family protein [Acidomonas methanolica]MBU2654587.1 YdcF family protein [Acidomonas methanolica]TCS27460.1 uncharacterized SAM-binding protein YcdF (DUF218 family) [Acidomonas methanolica]GAJ28059.1 hypothetical protein Amme_013_023 [Acidomonas methanolica NBRC 104435]GBQ45431.1 hypothetical protein AA0498_0052 [Acidomonas methanolica]GEK98633.1 hypothetical protein AME01nite_11320 [Acidomonas methanolica NBRC 104435]